MARLATSGFSLLTVAKRPGRPNRSKALICDKGVWSDGWVAPGDSPASMAYPCCCSRAFDAWGWDDDGWDAIWDSWKFCSREFRWWPCWFAFPADIDYTIPVKERYYGGRLWVKWRKTYILIRFGTSWLNLTWRIRRRPRWAGCKNALVNYIAVLTKDNNYEPPNPRSLGEKFLSTNAPDRPVSVWLLGILVIPCRFCIGLGGDTKVFELENPPNAAFCIKLPLGSWVGSSLPFLSSGGNSSMLPVCGWPDPDNWPIPPWPPCRYSSIPLENLDVAENKSSPVECVASWDCWFGCGGNWAADWGLPGCCCWGRCTGVCWIARWLAFAQMAWLGFENCVWGAPDKEGNSLFSNQYWLSVLYFSNSRCSDKIR